MKSFKEDIFNKIRDDYNENLKNGKVEESVLYQYILKNEIKEDVLKKGGEEVDKEVKKLANRRMYDFGFPLNGKESARCCNNTALNLIDEYLKEKTDNEYFDDFDPEPFEDLYNHLNAEKNKTALIPVRVDAQTGVGFYIIGCKHYVEFPKSYIKAGKTCGIGFLTNWLTDSPVYDEQNDFEDEEAEEDISLTLNFQEDYTVGDTDEFWEEYEEIGLMNDLPTITEADKYFRRYMMHKRFVFYKDQNGPKPKYDMPKQFDSYFAG